MSWKLDNIDFEDYGVIVSKSTGVLDLPEAVDNSINWLDENGRDYWQLQGDIKYQDRDINLSCYILASDYANFKTKLTNFYAALTSSGLRSLYTPYGNTIEVFVQQAIQITRATSYLQTQQVGIFNLRLTVPGDSKTKLITVYRMDGVVHNVFAYGGNAKLSKNLMGNDEITFSLELNYMSDDLNSIAREDYIMYNGSKYITFEHPIVNKLANNKYIHDCTFQHEFFRLKDIEFRVNDESNDYLYTTMEGIVDQIVLNMNRHYPGKFVRGTVDATINKNHQFSDEKCYTVLNRITADYELEFNYTAVGSTIAINVVQQVGNATGIELNYGKGKEITRIKVSPGLREKMVTRLYAYGASKNLPATYGSKRLKLATEPLAKNFYGLIVEQTKVWDDIYPERTGTISSYIYTPPSSVDKPETATYTLTDSSMPFDLKAKDESGNTIYWIAGTNPKIHFNSGDLAGFEFEVYNYDHTTKTFWITPLQNSDGSFYPDAVLKPGAGDEYVLLDINLPQSYIDNAEARLLARAQEYINFYYQPYGTYDIDVHPAVTTQVDAGDVIFITDPDFTSETDPQRVTSIVRNLYLGGSTLTISQTLKLSNRQLLEKKVDEMSRVLKSVAISEVNDQRNSGKTVGELSNKILNPLDEKFNANEVVRSQSFDPRMLSLDAATVQISVKDAMVETNFSGNKNKIKIGAGTLINHSFYALNREEIQKIKES